MNLTQSQVEKLMGIILPAVKDFNELGKLRQDHAAIRQYPVGGGCSAYRAVIQDKVSAEIDSFTAHRLGFFMHDLSAFLSDVGIQAESSINDINPHQ